MSPPLLLGALAPAAVAVVFARVGWVIADGRGLAAADRLPRAMFGVWWIGLGVSSAMSATLRALAGADLLPLTTAVALQFCSLAAVCVALWGLLAYLTYLFTGRRGYFWPLAAGYAVYLGWLMHAVASWNPTSIDLTPWRASLVYGDPGHGLSVALMGVLLLAPEMLASLALFGVALRMPAGASRRRVLVVASGILLWFGSALAGSAANVNGGAVWAVSQELLGVVVALGVLYAYRAPSRSASTVGGAGVASASAGDVLGGAER